MNKIRAVRSCSCRFQQKYPWGYILHEWVGPPRYWRLYARGRRFPLDEVEKRARKFTHVLISCGGCGDEMVREYPPKNT